MIWRAFRWRGFRPNLSAVAVRSDRQLSTLNIGVQVGRDAPRIRGTSI